MNKLAKFSNVEIIFGVSTSNLVFNVIIMTMKEVISRRREIIGIINIPYVKIILYNNIMEETFLISS